ncbi:MAG TPA: cysteine peptidase family C39 domain-containing protein [Planctomycetota bacterium]|nr:cysteine peptidase family C39 domain-containing protein [Planctomycetota bacterium]
MIWIVVQVLGSALMVTAGVLAVRRDRRLATALVGGMLLLLLAKVGVARIPDGEPRLFAWNWYPLVEGWWYLFPAMFIVGAALWLYRHSILRRDALLVVAGVLLLRCAAIGWVLARPSDLQGTVGPDGFCPQTSGYSCSAASAAMLLDRHGIRASEREMAELCVTCNATGTTPSGLMRGLRLKAGDRKAVRIGHPAFDRLPTPSIVSLRLSPVLTHSALVEKVTPLEVSVVDPLYGRGTLSRAIFDREWMGSAIWIE